MWREWDRDKEEGRAKYRAHSGYLKLSICVDECVCVRARTHIRACIYVFKKPFFEDDKEQGNSYLPIL